MLRQVMEESKQTGQIVNPDNMTYEELLELEAKQGKVSKGLPKRAIQQINSMLWYKGSTDSASCMICFDDFTARQRFKKMPGCRHEYHDTCIDKWLSEEKRCPVCNKEIKIY